MMTIEEVFESPAVKSVEIEILDVMSEVIGKWRDPQCEIAVLHLLTVRKNILNKMFVLTDEYKKLLEEFNDKLIDALLEMRSQTITMHNGALNADMYGVNTTGKVFMGYKYPAIHPIQTARAKKIWAVLNGSYDNFMPLYKDGVADFTLSERNPEIPSENQLLYLSEKIDNWNEELDRQKTADMHLCYGFHNLIDHNAFSFFDLLWVRDFSIEITCESNHCTGSEDWDEIDWNKCDYFD